MISYLIMLDIFLILVMTYVISYVILYGVSWYDQLKHLLAPNPKGLKK
jgi:hypothetical protein